MILRTLNKCLRCSALSKSDMMMMMKRCIGYSSMSPLSLSQIVDIDKLMKEDAPTISSIWQQYHDIGGSKMSSGRTISKDDAVIIKSRAQASPLFIFPIFKKQSSDNSDDAFILLLSQSQKEGFVFTYLEEYKNNPNTASPWMSLMMYSDFEEQKSITLIRTDYTANVTKHENLVISRMLTDAYLNNSLYNLMSTFNKEPAKFDFEKFLAEYKKKYLAEYITNA